MDKFCLEIRFALYNSNKNTLVENVGMSTIVPGHVSRSYNRMETKSKFCNVRLLKVTQSKNINYITQVYVVLFKIQYIMT